MAALGPEPSCGMGSSARWIHNLLLPLEKLELESQDCGEYLDGRGNCLRSVEDERLPRRLVNFDLPPTKDDDRVQIVHSIRDYESSPRFSKYLRGVVPRVLRNMAMNALGVL